MMEMPRKRPWVPRVAMVRHADVGDQGSVQRAADHGDRQGGKDPQQDDNASGRGNGAGSREHGGGHDSREAGDGSDGQIDSARDHGQHVGQGQQAVLGELPAHGGKVYGSQELAGHEDGEDPANHDEDDEKGQVVGQLGVHARFLLGPPASTLDQRKGAPALDPLLDVRDADAQHDDQPDKELLPVR